MSYEDLITAPKDDDDTPPANDGEKYRASEGRRDGRGDFLWFVSWDGLRDEMLPLADIRRMEPPRDPKNEVVYIHFSGIAAVLHGVNLRRVLQRLAMRRCAAVFEFKPGQQKPPEGEPIIERFEFKDTRAPRRPEPDGGARH